MQDTDPRGGTASAADWRMLDDVCGDFGLSIRRDGTWFYRGSPIGRKPLVKLFASVLRRDEQGRYWLVTPAEKGRIDVEDVPFVAVEANFTGKGREQTVTLRTNLDEIVTVGPDFPLRVEEDAATGEPRPYARVRDGLEARLARPVFYDLVDHGEEREEDGRLVLGIWSGGAFFRLGALDAANAADPGSGGGAAP
ncbi:MAG: DUF1285 domain-containing protein [Rhodospirillaceae bacterium]|nr:DUF1285 domain-containing protein [Rhodospirillaceae bacterium]